MRKVLALFLTLLAGPALAQSSSFDPNYGGSGGASTPTPTRSFVSGNFYRPTNVQNSASTGAIFGSARAICTTGNIATKTTFSGISDIVIAAAAGNQQWGVYADANGRPGALIAQTATGSQATAGAVTMAFSANVQLGPGTAGGAFPWFCVQEDSTSTATYTSVAIAGGNGGFLVGSITLTNVLSPSAEIAGVLCSGAGCTGGTPTFGTMPATLAGSTWIDLVSRGMPTFALPIVSVP